VTASLYLHIPFCTAKCDYCDFYSIPIALQSPRERDLLLGRSIDALLAETEKRLAEFPPLRGLTGKLSVPTVYIGGGTPSVLGAAGIARLMQGLAALTGSPVPVEITVEANPETADDAFLEACRSNGVTRLSLGVQSFDKGVRRAAGRRGDGSLLPRRLKAASEIFGEALSLDLMSGLPGQSRKILLGDIEMALTFHPGHISLYALTLEEGTPLAGRANSPEYAVFSLLPGQDEMDRLWLAGRDALVKAGYEQYEVSNFALPDKRCVHNIRYWRMENWLGIGPAASGTIIGSDGRGIRTSYASLVNEASLPDFVPLQEVLDSSTVLRETLLMGFRYIDGPDTALFRERFGKSMAETIPNTLEKWKGSTEKRMLFLNSFLLDAFAELDTIDKDENK
jgi:oxygen-independent coproporphyrinogen-3 oxidase